MTTQDAIDNLQYLLNQLWNRPERFTDGTVQDLIEAIEDHAIPALGERVKTENIADEFVKLGNLGPVLSPEELERALKLARDELRDIRGFINLESEK